MLRKFKVGDKVIPMESTYKEWQSTLTKDKVYLVVAGNWGVVVVYSNNGRSHWSNPHKYFTKVVPKNTVGGKIL